MPEFISLKFKKLPPAEQVRRAGEFFEMMSHRRSVREYSTQPVPLSAVMQCVETASTAPSGAHKQPWKFALVSDPALKRRIREAAEREEYINYQEGRLPAQWRRDIASLGTDWHKPFLEDAPCLIVVFADYRKPVYYVSESVGIAVGFLLCALHNAGFAALTHTPSPMRFLGELLGRPKHEKAFVLIPVGYPAEGTTVPDLRRKTLEEVLIVKSE